MNQESLKKYLTAEIRFILAIVAFVWGVAVPYFGIKTDIAIIKQNHMAHVEMYGKELSKLSDIQTKQQDTIIQLMKEISKLQ